MPRAVVDFETRSLVDLSECGQTVYAEDPSTDILCMGWALDDEPPELWLPFDPFPEKLRMHVESGGEVYAHNYAFDRAIWNSIAIPRYGHIAIPDDQWRCTMATAYSMGFPGKLEKAALALGLNAQKDMKASRVMKRLSRPRSFTDGKPVWWDDLQKHETTYQYCLQDIAVTQELLKHLVPLSNRELPVFQLDREINDRGLRIDTRAVCSARTILLEEKERLDDEMQKVTGNFVSSCDQVAKLTQWIQSKGVNIPGVSKAVVEEALKQPDLLASCRQALLLRQEAAKTSTRKLDAMEARVDAARRIQWAFQYCGANTHRWAGRGVQFQNFPRTSLLRQDRIEEVLDGLAENTITAERLNTFYGQALSVLANCLRGFIHAEEDKKFITGDYSAIEARVLAWLAGEEKVLEIFRSHGKIYEAAASDIFNVPIDKVTSEQRQIGKTACLACGFGGGIGAFQKMSVNYGVKISDEKAEIVKLRWREANRKIVKYWYALDNAARFAIKNPGAQFRAGASGREVIFMKSKNYLLCKLPSGRVLFYPYPKLEEVIAPWGEKKIAVTYKAEDSVTHQWTTQKTFPGFWSEQATQSLSRDILAEAMLRLKAEGWSIVLHSHDEIMCEETPSEKFSVKELERIMTVLPEWAEDLPLKVKGWTGTRYRKD